MPSASAFQSIAQFFIQGGVFMIFLMLLSLVALTVIVWRSIALRMKVVLPPVIEDVVARLEPLGDLGELESVLEQNPSPLSRVLQTLTFHCQYSREEALEAIQTRARHEVMRLETGLVFLEIATGVAPILGLLGTLSGLVGIFASIGSDPVLVARGIAEALNTTIVGLAVAAPSLIAFNYFSRKVEIMAVTMETLAAEVLAKCQPSRDLEQ